MGAFLLFSDYLKTPTRQFQIPALLIGLGTYSVFTSQQPYLYSGLVVLLILMAGTCVVFRQPRWIVYLWLFLALIIRLVVFTLIISKQDQDSLSTRDAAVEVTAQAMLRGENAWNANPGVGVTTGPTSILLALPFVALLGEINWLTFGFWLTLFSILLWADVKLKNNTWPTLVMFFITGEWYFEHTLFWSLDELYFPMIYLIAGYWLALRQKWFWVGVMLTASVLTRPSYIFLILGFGLWQLFNNQFTRRNLLQQTLGAVIGAIIIISPFIVIGGADFWINNPWRFAFDFSGAAWPNTNILFQTLNQLNSEVGPQMMRLIKLGVTILILAIFSIGFKRRFLHHPFWHIMISSLLAHTIVWLPAQWAPDYALMIILPAVIAIALSRTSIQEGA